MRECSVRVARKRSVRDIIEFCGWDALVAMAQRATSRRDAAIIATLFLTGGRVSEVLSLIVDDFDLSNQEVIILRHMDVSKRFKKTGEKIVNGKKEWITEKVFAHRSFAILKKEPLVPFLLDYLVTLKPGAKLFSLSRVRIYQIVRKLSGMYPHWFRAQRACQLAEEHDLGLNEIMNFFQWRDQMTAMRYTSLGWRALARKQGAKV